MERRREETGGAPLNLREGRGTLCAAPLASGAGRGIRRFRQPVVPRTTREPRQAAARRSPEADGWRAIRPLVTGLGCWQARCERPRQTCATFRDLGPVILGTERFPGGACRAQIGILPGSPTKWSPRDSTRATIPIGRSCAQKATAEQGRNCPKTSAPFPALLQQRFQNSAANARVAFRWAQQLLAYAAAAGHQKTGANQPLPTAVAAFLPPQGHQLGDGYASLGDDDFGAPLHPRQVCAQARLQFRNSRFVHMTILVNWSCPVNLIRCGYRSELARPSFLKSAVSPSVAGPYESVGTAVGYGLGRVQ